MTTFYKELVKRYYTKGIYSIEDVKTFVRANKLTPEEYQEITGEIYI